MTYAQHAEGCLQELNWDEAEHAHFSYMGEDKFMQRCMDLHGVDRIPSTVELGKSEQEGLHTTITCPAHIPKTVPKNWHAPCNKTTTAGIHPLKDPKSYFTCLRETQLIDTHTDDETQWMID